MAVEPPQGDLAEPEELTVLTRAETVVVKPGEDPTEEAADEDDPTNEDDEEARPVEAGGAPLEGEQRDVLRLDKLNPSPYKSFKILPWLNN